MLKNLRKNRNLTQEQLGVLSGMTKSQISRMEKGVLGSPETINRLLEAMGYATELKVVDRYAVPDGEILIMLKSPSLFIYADIQAVLESILKRRVSIWYHLKQGRLKASTKRFLKI